uniref:Uncharacterized protein n=1 Tax=Accipiter nisus TaxID=211598 RepID=A0A8B9MYX7_9AVES
MGTGEAAESVIDPDMVALFEDFLGKGSARWARGQNGLCLHNGHLVATRLQGANAAQEEPISVVPNQYLERRRCPLIVGIRGGTQALSCGTGPEPQLKLEVSTGRASWWGVAQLKVGNPRWGRPGVAGT